MSAREKEQEGQPQQQKRAKLVVGGESNRQGEDAVASFWTHEFDNISERVRVCVCVCVCVCGKLAWQALASFAFVSEGMCS